MFSSKRLKYMLFLLRQDDFGGYSGSEARSIGQAGNWVVRTTHKTAVNKQTSQRWPAALS